MLVSLLKLQWIVLASFLTIAAAVAGNAKPGCQPKCGNHTIDYPFGIGEGCYIEGFEISCNTSYDPPKPFLAFRERVCPRFFISRLSVWMSSPSGPFLSGCSSGCDDKREGVTDGSCSRLGCCQTSIPPSFKSIGTGILNIFNDSMIKEIYNESQVSSLYHCGYAFRVDQESYIFEATDLDQCYSSKIEQSCCLEYVYENGQGYRCSCKHGYEGNPYLRTGCQGQNNPCQGKGTCINLPDGYNCTCPHGAKSDGETCILRVSKFPTLQLVLGLGSLFFVLLLVPSAYIYITRRRLIKLKEKFFQQNGGLLLQQQIPVHEGSGEPPKIFTTHELAKATDNYAESRVIGQGGNGIVYKGILSENKVVAVKKSKMVDKTQIEQFINEVIVLTQINHRNVVKLLGCCLETEVPLLVYEFVTNGSLDYHLRNYTKAGSISWNHRLCVANETAGALAYLHSATIIPIIHRDVKSSNILLDDKCVKFFIII
ncbi:hypothetical protein PTKIN_Ptkin01aG0240100 [Pterospermum kingtungense]